VQAPILLAFAAGVVSFLSPCIIPMISVYLTLITGMSLDELRGSGGLVSRRSLISNTALFCLGFIVVFTLAGGAAGALGSLIDDSRRVLEVGGGAVVVVLGLSMTGLLQISWLQKLGLPLNRPSRKPRGPLGSFLVGLFFAVACSHCIAPTLLAMVAVAGSTGSAAGGMLTMLAFSLGLAVPYLLTAVAVRPALQWLAGRSVFARRVQLASGVLLAAFGVLMVAGEFTRLTEITTRLVPYTPPLGM
jgi:cytochrome c-type biogenesis protein